MSVRICLQRRIYINCLRYTFSVNLLFCIEQRFINSPIRASVSVRLIINFCIIIRVDNTHCENNKKFSQTYSLCNKNTGKVKKYVQYIVQDDCEISVSIFMVEISLTYFVVTVCHKPPTETTTANYFPLRTYIMRCFTQISKKKR